MYKLLPWFHMWFHRYFWMILTDLKNKFRRILADFQWFRMISRRFLYLRRNIIIGILWGYCNWNNNETWKVCNSNSYIFTTTWNLLSWLPHRNDINIIIITVSCYNLLFIINFQFFLHKYLPEILRFIQFLHLIFR